MSFAPGSCYAITDKPAYMGPPLYFYSNKTNNSVTKLIKKFSTFSSFEKSVEGYKNLLRRYKDEYEALKREIGG